MRKLNIVMLGGSGAGKTTYLASLFKRLAIQGNGPYNSFFLDVDDNQDRRKLNNIFASIVSPNEDWPPGTRSIKDWQFKCCVKNHKGKEYKVCSFNYIDYAGGTISDVLDDEQGRFNQMQLDQRVQEASILLGLLDGEKIVDFMQDKPSSIDWLNGDLINIIQVMNRASVPIHFVISKWDFVKEIGRFSLGEIRDKLLEVQELNALVNRRNDRIRIIPVSSVGEGFANFVPMSNGEMKTLKTGKIFVQPYQVEVPLAYVLIDVIQNASEKLQERINNMNEFAKFFFFLKCIFINPLLEFMPPGSHWISREFVEKINNMTFGVKITTSLGDINDEKAAIDHVINCFKIIIDEFEDSGNSLMKKRQK